MSTDVLNRNSGSEALSRLTVKEGKPFGLDFPTNAYRETNSEISVFDTGEIEFMGHKFQKSFFAAGVGDDVSKIDSPTASAIFKFFGVKPGHLNPEIDVTIGVLMNAATRVELEDKIADLMQSSTSEETILKISSTNTNQELKEDGKAGLILDLSGLALTSLNNITNIDIIPTEMLGQAKNGMRFTYIKIAGATTSQKDLPVCSAQSTSRGVYRMSFGDQK